MTWGKLRASNGRGRGEGGGGEGGGRSAALSAKWKPRLAIDPITAELLGKQCDFSFALVNLAVGGVPGRCLLLQRADGLGRGEPAAMNHSTQLFAPQPRGATPEGSCALHSCLSVTCAVDGNRLMGQCDATVAGKHPYSWRRGVASERCRLRRTAGDVISRPPLAGGHGDAGTNILHCPLQATRSIFLREPRVDTSDLLIMGSKGGSVLLHYIIRRTRR
jgi:hypothetical protein